MPRDLFADQQPQQRAPRDLFGEPPPAPQPTGLPELQSGNPPSETRRTFMRLLGDSWRRDTAHAGRQIGLLGRTIAEGTVDAVSPYADAIGLGLNKVGEALPLPLPRFPDRHSEAMTSVLTGAGVPTPETQPEQSANFWGRLATGAAVGNAMTKPLMAGVRPPQPQYATTRAARTLENAGVPLDRAQRSGGEFMTRMRSALHDNPLTTSAQARFSERQLRAYTRSVLETIGENSDEASQEVMDSAYKRIGAVFNEVGKAGARFDDELATQLDEIIDSARSTTTASDLEPLLKNIKDIRAAVDQSGMIGPQLTRIRSHLSALGKNPGVGAWARETEDALLSAVERTHPGQRAILRPAIDQFRNMRIIETAIGKGDERLISPKILSNTVSSMRNRAMSVYGRGGDQWLVRLARAGRDVLPESLPQSGTVPRGMMQAQGIARAALSYPFYKGTQMYMQSQPSPGSGVLKPAAGAVAGAASAFSNALASRKEQERRNALR